MNALESLTTLRFPGPVAQQPSGTASCAFCRRARAARAPERPAHGAERVPLLAAYYMLKTAREVFILSEGGAEVKSYSSAGQALLLLILVPAYGAFASRVNRVQLVRWVTLFFVANLALFLSGAQCRPARSASSTFCGSGSST